MRELSKWSNLPSIAPFCVFCRQRCALDSFKYPHLSSDYVALQFEIRLSGQSQIWAKEIPMSSLDSTKSHFSLVIYRACRISPHSLAEALEAAFENVWVSGNSLLVGSF